MRILLVTESYWPNADGGAHFERRLVKGLIGRGHTLWVWAPSERLKSYEEIDDNYTIYREKSHRSLINAKYRLSFFPFLRGRRMLMNLQPDVIHIHNASALGFCTLFWARRYHIPVVATNHFMPENLLMNLPDLKWLHKRLYDKVWWYLVRFHNRTQFVISPTRTALDMLVERGLTVPHAVVSNGIDTEVFRPGLDAAVVRQKYHISVDMPIMLYVGRLDGEKRVDLIIRALPDILSKQQVQLVLCGYGKALPGLQRLADELGVSQHVIFTGYIEEADKPLMYNLADVFVIASPAELQSIVTLEAMSSGLPIVAVDVAALKELCHDNENGFLFPRDDHRALSACVSRLLQDTSLRDQFGRESLRIAATHATGRTSLEHERIYQRVISQQAQSPTSRR